MTVKIKARLPKGDLDGLQHTAQQIDDDPDRIITCVVLLKPADITTNLLLDDNPRDMGLQIVHVEALDNLDEMAAESFLRAAYEKRTGKQPLPFGSFLPDAAADGLGDGDESAVGPSQEEIDDMLDKEGAVDDGDSDGDDGDGAT